MKSRRVYPRLMPKKSWRPSRARVSQEKAMPNEYVRARLEGLLHSMYGQYLAGGSSASATKGAGRAEFVRNFLSRVNGPAFRIQESAEITDIQGNKTGEVDIVLENGHAPNLPTVDGETSRLHFAEGVGAALEVKSSLSGQWDQAVATAQKVRAITRNFAGATFAAPGKPHIIQLPFTINNPDPNMPRIQGDPYPFSKRIPLFLVGYTGWSGIEALKKKASEAEDLFAGILQIQPTMYIGSKHLSGQEVTGPWSLLSFLADLHTSFAHIKSASFDILDYGR